MVHHGSAVTGLSFVGCILAVYAMDLGRSGLQLVPCFVFW